MSIYDSDRAGIEFRGRRGAHDLVESGDFGLRLDGAGTARTWMMRSFDGHERLYKETYTDISMQTDTSNC